MNKPKTGSELEYNKGRKKQWRKWQWNRIKERFGGVVHDKVGLFLLGKNAHDFEIATNKGFKSYNLIGVDLLDDNICLARKKGILAIDGYLHHILFGAKNIKIDFVVADLCSGITPNNVNILVSILCSQALHQSTVVSINMLRGHDPMVKAIPFSIVDLRHYWETGEERISKHRGDYVISIYCFYLMKLLKQVYPNRFCSRDIGRHTMSEILRLMKPKFNSYKTDGGNAYMDTVIFNRVVAGHCKIGLIDECDKNKELLLIQNASKKLNAIKAVRTMRMAA